MKKQELPNFINDELLDNVFGFCYARTKDSYEAEELCSDIVYALMKASQSDGEIENLHAFIWRVARNVYADFSDKKRKRSETAYGGDPETVLLNVAEEEHADDTNELLTSVYRRIAFLTKAYRDVMIMFYIDGLSASEIAKRLGTSEGAIRQRLFSARQKIKGEVENMNETTNKPVSLNNIDFVIWGTGNPSWGDPREDFYRQFSKHIVWLCRKKPMSAIEIAEELNVPTQYVEEELEILRKGENGEYGLLRRSDNGKYIINFVLLEKDVIEKANEIYTEQLPNICEIITNFINENKSRYLAYPYLNKKVDMNLILWQQISSISHAFSNRVSQLLHKNHFTETKKVERPFSVFGYENNGKLYGGGWDGIAGNNICGYGKIHLDNIYITRIKKHFSCGHDISNDPLLQLAIRAISGLDINSLYEQEKEHAAKAIECGYLYREGDTLYTKILVCPLENSHSIFDVTNELQNGYFDKEAEIIAEKLAKLIKQSIPEHLIDEWRYANSLASMPILDAVVEHLIEKGVLTPPENGIGAEGCWMYVGE